MPLTALPPAPESLRRLLGQRPLRRRYQRLLIASLVAVAFTVTAPVWLPPPAPVAECQPGDEAGLSGHASAGDVTPAARRLAELPPGTLALGLPLTTALPGSLLQVGAQLSAIGPRGVIASHLEVLTAPAPASQPASVWENTPSEDPAALVVAVTPEQAANLTKALHEGSLTVAVMTPDVAPYATPDVNPPTNSEP